jgi:hypothetical protein
MFREFLDKVIELRDNLIGGKQNCIPLPFKKTSRYIPGIVRGRNVTVTANSGVGKTQITKFMYVFWPFIWCRENNVPLKVFYFALEESKEEFIASATSFFLRWYYNISIETDTLLSMNGVFSDEILGHLRKIEPLMDEFLKTVIIEDNISNPTGIFKYLKNHAVENGTTTYKNMTIDNKEVKVFDTYEPNNKEEYWIAVADHIGLFTEEQGKTLHQTISLFSAEYGRKKITKRYNYCLIQVQQQSASSEAKEYNNKGELNYTKLEPSLSDLADNKFTQRDQHLVWGLFSPDRYEIPVYKNWDIQKLQDNFRSLHVLKNRNGRSNIKVSLYFEGDTNFFSELPSVDSDIMGKKSILGIPIEQWYSKFKNNIKFWLNPDLFN